MRITSHGKWIFGIDRKFGADTVVRTVVEPAVSKFTVTEFALAKLALAKLALAEFALTGLKLAGFALAATFFA